MTAQPSLSPDQSSLEAATGAGLSDAGQYVTFSCADRSFGVDIMSVREIRSWSPTTALPNQPHAACGALDIRGEVIQVYDLKTLIGAGRTEASEGHVVVVLAIGDVHVGVLVETVNDIIAVNPDKMRAAPPVSEGVDIVTGIANHDDKLVAILDLSPILGKTTH